eukprot:COSAG04_NODE_560_length_12599_cov_40.846640_5_plen_514_part_00
MTAHKVGRLHSEHWRPLRDGLYEKWLVAEDLGGEKKRPQFLIDALPVAWVMQTMRELLTEPMHHQDHRHTGTAESWLDYWTRTKMMEPGRPFLNFVAASSDGGHGSEDSGDDDSPAVDDGTESVVGQPVGGLDDADSSTDGGAESVAGDDSSAADADSVTDSATADGSEAESRCDDDGSSLAAYRCSLNATESEADTDADTESAVARTVGAIDEADSRIDGDAESVTDNASTDGSEAGSGRDDQGGVAFVKRFRRDGHRFALVWPYGGVFHGDIVPVYDSHDDYLGDAEIPADSQEVLWHHGRFGTDYCFEILLDAQSGRISEDEQQLTTVYGEQPLCDMCNICDGCTCGQCEFFTGCAQCDCAAGDDDSVDSQQSEAGGSVASEDEVRVGDRVDVFDYGRAEVTGVNDDGSIAVQYDSGSSWSRVEPDDFRLVAAVHSEEEFTFKCEYCFKAFNVQGYLTAGTARHARDQHQDVCPIACLEPSRNDGGPTSWPSSQGQMAVRSNFLSHHLSG